MNAFLISIIDVVKIEFMGNDLLHIDSSLSHCCDCLREDIPVAEYGLDRQLLVHDLGKAVADLGLGGDSDQDDRPASSCNIRRLADAYRSTAGIEDLVHSAAFCDLHDLLDRILLPAVDHDIGSQFLSLLKPCRNHICQDDLSCSMCFRGKQGAETDAAAAENCNGITYLDISLIGCMETYRKRLDQSAFLGADIIRKLEAPVRRMRDIFLIASRDRRRRKETDILPQPARFSY